MPIYIANLAYEVAEEDLKRVFSQYGTVQNIQFPTNQQTGKSRGFALIAMETYAEEVSAIQMMRGSEWMGRILKVNRATISLS